MTSQYRCHGLTLRSEIPLAEAMQCDANADVDIRQGEVPTQLSGPTCEGAFYQAHSRAFLLNIRGVGRYLAIDGCRIEVQAEGGPEAVRLFLYGSPMAALLQQRGMLVVQGSAVKTRHGAVVIVGPPAAGKSLVAAALWQRGCCEPMADDLCAITLDPPVLHPGPAFLSLWGRDVAALGLGDSARRMRAGLDRFIVPVPHAGSAPTALFAICALDTWNESTPRVTSPTGAGRCAPLLASLYNRHVLERSSREGRHLRQVARLGHEIRVFQAWRQRAAVSIQPLVSSLCSALNL